jgi:hypothetical protein
MAKSFRFISTHAAELINNAVMLEVECSKVGGTFCTDMEMKGFPSVVLIFKDKYMKYTGSRTHTAMAEFLGDQSRWVFEDLPTKMSTFIPKTAVVDGNEEL